MIRITYRTKTDATGRTGTVSAMYQSACQHLAVQVIESFGHTIIRIETIGGAL